MWRSAGKVLVLVLNLSYMYDCLDARIDTSNGIIVRQYSLCMLEPADTIWPRRGGAHSDLGLLSGNQEQRKKLGACRKALSNSSDAPC